MKKWLLLKWNNSLKKTDRKVYISFSSSSVLIIPNAILIASFMELKHHMCCLSVLFIVLVVSFILFFINEDLFNLLTILLDASLLLKDSVLDFESFKDLEY